MKCVKSIIILLTGCVILSSCMISKPVVQDSPRTITVSGNGKVSVTPDLIILKFSVKTTDWNVSKAVEKNAVNSQFVFDALKNSGVDINDVSTSDYKILQDNSRAVPGQYTVTNTISVIIRNTEITGQVIDAAVKSNIGANGLTSFDYSISDNSSALRQARTAAIQDAQDAAALLAGASGCKVGKVISINENHSSKSKSSAISFSRASAEANTSILPAEVNITSNVTITYELEN